jgi:glycine/D-amino acid oxidase-like deaminating enzyme
MKVAVVGAGFAGLATAWYLAADTEVVVFDEKGVGGGASGIAAGLAHPYVGAEARRSERADEALDEMNALMDCVEGELKEAVRSYGIVRIVEDDRLERYADVKRLEGDRWLVTSGRVVNCPLYLQGLWSLIEKRGGRLRREKVEDVAILEGFDQVVIAAGAWSGKIKGIGPLSASVLKGQVLVCRAKEGVVLPEMSLVGKGYMAIEKRQCYIGSTYERGLVDERADMKVCQELILPKIAPLFPLERLEIVEARASLRLCMRPHYFPLVRKEREGVWVVTGLGSRGLLYHALVGKEVANRIREG